MRVAIAGSSNVGKYLIEELLAKGHQVIQLSRSRKPSHKNVQLVQTDYSIASLVKILNDCDALVSTIVDYEAPSSTVRAHLDMFEACKQSERCKTFIPSEWTSNVEDYPEQPMFFTDANKVIHKKVHQETEIRSTIICNSWFADYVCPADQRYLRDIGPIWPMNHDEKIFTIYGPGTQLVDLVFVRDVAKGVTALLESEEPWETYTYFSGSQLTWNELFQIIKRHDPKWTSRNKPLADTIRQIADSGSAPEDILLCQFEVLSYAGASAFPKEKVDRHRTRYFQHIHFRTVEEVLAGARRPPGRII